MAKNPWDDLPEVPPAAAAAKNPWDDLPEAPAEELPAEAPPAAPPAPIGKGAARGMGVLEALSYGFAPKMHGVAKSAMGSLGERVQLGAAFQPSPDDTPEIAALKQQALAQEAAQPSDYELNKQAYQGLNRQAEKERPLDYYGAQVGTGLAQGIGGGLMAPARAAARAAGAAVPSLLRRMAMSPLGARVLSGGGEGILQGGLSGAGHSQADVTKEGGVGDLIKDTAIGSGVGLGFGVGLPVLGAAARGVGRGIVNFAEEEAPEWALKAAGGIQKDFRALGEDARAYGQFLLDQGMIPFAGSKTAILNRLRGLQGRSGETIGRTRDANTSTPDIVSVLQQARGDLDALEPTTRDLQGPTRRRLMRNIREKFGASAPDEMVQTATRNLNANELANTKRAMDEIVNWRPQNAKEAQASQGARAVANRLRGEEYALAERGLSPEDNAAFRQAMAQYGPASDLINVAEQGVAREGGNSLLGMMAPIMAGSIGVGTQLGGGDGLGSGLGSLAALVALKRYGPAAAARALQGVARTGQRLDPARLPPSVLRALASPRGLAAPLERSLAPSALPQRSYAPLEAYLDEER